MTLRLVLIFSFFAQILAADQNVTVGNPIRPNGADLQTAPVRTDIDLSRPASATGTLSIVTYSWSDNSCSDTFKIKFFRRIGDVLTMTDERGPFTVAPDHAVGLVPSVSVQQGDLIAITRLSGCGSPQTETNDLSKEGYLQFTGDINGNVDIAGGTKSFAYLGVFGQGVASEVLAAIIPVVGSAAGAFDSNFKTALQIVLGPSGNPPYSVRLVFHPARLAGKSTDPSMTLAIDGGQLIGLPDLVAAMGQSGLGSIDVLLSPFVPLPTFVTRVYNDSGLRGTTGLVEELVVTTSTRVLHVGQNAVLIGPSSSLNQRFNIGIRTLYSGVQITAILHEANNTLRAKVTKHYPATYFEQVDASTFFNGVSITGDNWIQIEIQQGSAIIYGSTIDNITYDAAMQVANWAF